MTDDPRLKFILNQINAAKHEINPDLPSVVLAEEDRAVVLIAIKVFDRLLPMAVTIIMNEYHKQKGVK